MCQYLKTEGFGSSPAAVTTPQRQYSPLQSGSSVTVAPLDHPTSGCSDTSDALIALKAVHGALRGRLPFETIAQDHGSMAEGGQGHQTAMIVLGSMQDGDVTDQVLRVDVILLTSDKISIYTCCEIRSPSGPKHYLSRPPIPPHAASPSRPYNPGLNAQPGIDYTIRRCIKRLIITIRSSDNHKLNYVNLFIKRT